MSYTVWIKVENDDDADSAPDVAWWSVVTAEGITRQGAIEMGEAVVDALRDAGYDPFMLDTDEEEDGPEIEILSRDADGFEAVIRPVE